jgi:hypothetical protein
MHLKSLFIGWKCTAANGVCTAADAGSAALLSVLFTFFLATTPAAAQTPSGSRHEVFAGSELENYFRYMQSMGRTIQDPWSVRPFSPQQVDEFLVGDSSGPWNRRFDSPTAKRGLVKFDLLSPTVSARVNTGFPYGYNDGPIWAGRGLTTSAQAGFFLRVGVVSLTIAPMVFRAENERFELFSPSQRCPPDCGNGLFPGGVDLPQRFGDRAYQRVDPGQSTLRVDAMGVSAGVSTANEWWGPTQLYPFLLGNNAPGFRHVFFGTGRPLGILIGRISARVFYGRLDQSPYSIVTGSRVFVSDSQPGRDRFMSGLVAVFQPGGIDGLELGGGRFVHAPWPASGLPRSYLLDPFKGFFKSSLSGNGVANNQLSSIFARWMFPRSGLEFYGEYGRDDASYDFRDLMQEPDHSRTYSLGLRKTLRSSPAGFEALNFELMNYQLPTLARTGRGEGLIYTHGALHQGHTERGQLLGSPLGPGAAAGSTLSWSRYTPNGRWTAALERTVSQEIGNFYTTGILNPKSSDVSHALRFEKLTFLRSLDLTTGLTLVREFNRDFRRDAWNLNGIVTAAYRIN